MDAIRFDPLTRSLERHTPRRGALSLLGGGLTALLMRAGLHDAFAKQGKNKTPKLNEFGCVNVGSKCRGKDSLCCSGICQGKKPKKGQKDKSRCVAHDQTSCQAGQTTASCGGANVLCTTRTGEPGGGCLTTTGGAGYCAASIDCPTGNTDCATDADCRDRCGPHAACVLCPAGEPCASSGGSAGLPSTRCGGPFSGACGPTPK